MNLRKQFYILMLLAANSFTQMKAHPALSLLRNPAFRKGASACTMFGGAAIGAVLCGRESLDSQNSKRVRWITGATATTCSILGLKVGAQHHAVPTALYAISVPIAVYTAVKIVKIVHNELNWKLEQKINKKRYNRERRLD